MRHIAHRAEEPGLVEVWPLIEQAEAEEEPPWDAPVDAPPTDAPAARLAETVAETIASWIGREWLPARGRTIRAGDILVLVRKREPIAGGLIKALKARGAPVSGADRLDLAKELVVKDLLALGRFCLYPEDDLTLATLLRSPFCDVSEDALFDLAHGRAGRRRLWYALEERKGERPEFGHAHAFLGDLVRRADFERPFELFAHALGPLGGRARLVARLGREAEDPIDELIADALRFESAESPSLERFVARSLGRSQTIKREHEQGRDEIRVMTAHGAKGLEAPVVVLPDTTAPPGDRAPTLLDPARWDALGSDAPPVWMGPKASDTGGLATLRAAVSEREAQEHRRLLYVALTRAEDRLLICGAARKKGPADPDSWYGLVSAALDGWGEVFETPIDRGDGRAASGWRLRGAGEGGRGEHVSPTEAAAPPRPDWLDRPAPRENAPADISPSALGGDDPEARGGGAVDRDLAIRRGLAIHTMLERLGGAPPGPERRARARVLLAAEHPGLGAEMHADAIAEAEAVIDAPALAALFGPGARAEVPVTGVLADLGPGEIHGAIDRIVVEPKRVLIADFKTGAPHDPPPEGYLRQLAVYRAVVARLYPDRPVEAALVWTANQSLAMIDGRALDAAFSRAARAVVTGG